MAREEITAEAYSISISEYLGKGESILDGLDTYKLFMEIHPKQKAIIVSGFSESDRVTAAQALGAGEYVRKPYVIEKLGLALRKELEKT